MVTLELRPRWGPAHCRLDSCHVRTATGGVATRQASNVERAARGWPVPVGDFCRLWQQYGACVEVCQAVTGCVLLASGLAVVQSERSAARIAGLHLVGRDDGPSAEQHLERIASGTVERCERRTRAATVEEMA
jgi:hypothetical protein